MSPHCKLCGWVEQAKGQGLNSLIWESDWSIAVVGEHQFYKGYTMLISKVHIREMHNLDPVSLVGLFNDLMRLGRAIEAKFKPLKINYATLGNVEEHLHWHVIPRYESENDPKSHPWVEMNQFSRFPTTIEQMNEIRSSLQGF